MEPSHTSWTINDYYFMFTFKLGRHIGDYHWCLYVHICACVRACARVCVCVCVSVCASVNTHIQYQRLSSRCMPPELVYEQAEINNPHLPQETKGAP
jgi:hypothetical protein